MTDRDRLIELLFKVTEEKDCPQPNEITDYLLENGVTVPPCKVGDYVRFKGLTTLWQVAAIHQYLKGSPQITVTNGKISNTVADDGMFEVFTKEEVGQALAERNRK